MNIGTRNGTILLLASLAANIFLLAFVLGRFSTPGMMPPPPWERPHSPHDMHGPDGGPPLLREGGHPPGDMPPPPPPHLFSPADLLTPDEMRQDAARMRANFEKISELRTAFANQLKQGPISAQDVLKHFAEVDQLMHEVRNQTQEKAAEKISAMTPAQRQHFADQLLER